MNRRSSLIKKIKGVFLSRREIFDSLGLNNIVNAHYGKSLQDKLFDPEELADSTYSLYTVHYLPYTCSKEKRHFFNKQIDSLDNHLELWLINSFHLYLVVCCFLDFKIVYRTARTMFKMTYAVPLSFLALFVVV